MMNRPTNIKVLAEGQVVVVVVPQSSWNRKRVVVCKYHPKSNTATVHRFGSERRKFSTRNLCELYEGKGKMFVPGANKPTIPEPSAYPVGLDDVSDDNHSFFSDGGDDLWSDDDKDYAELGREKKRSEQYRREQTNADGTEKSYYDLIIENRALRKEIKRLQLSIRAVTNQLISDVNNKVNSFTAVATETAAAP
jgi:hypothetical protein